MEPENLVYETVTEEMPGAEGTEPATLTWRVFKDHAELAGCSGNDRGTLTIPSEFRELPVTAIRKDSSQYYTNYYSKIVIPDSVSAIESAFFSDFYMLKEVETGAGNKNYKCVDGVLFDAKGETLLVYPKQKQDEEYTVPGKTETIGESAFYLNSFLKKVTLPKSLRTIGKSAFGSCSSLSVVEFAKGLKEIGDRAFSGCPLQDVKLPSSVTSIGASAFTPGEGYGKIELPDKLEKMGYAAFTARFNEPFIQDEIRIPANLVITNKFLDNILFERFEVDEKSGNYMSADGLLMSKDGRTLVGVPTLLEGDLIVPDGILYIEYSALEGCGKVTDIYLPDSVLSIGNIGAKDYETGEYRFVIHCNAGTEVQRRLDAKGIPWAER